MKDLILKWTLIGLLIRFLIMPFSSDVDIFWLNYVPHQLVKEGIWDGYSFVKEHFWERIGPSRNPYYPPLTYFMIAFFQFLFKPFMPTLNNWFENYERFLKLGGGIFLQHLILPGTTQIFRNIFFLKFPLLLFDFGIGLLLLRMCLLRNEDSLFVYKLWMLNPATIYAGFGYGQIDIYPTFFVVLSLYLVMLNKPYMSIVSLGLGALTKSYPLILMPLAAVFLKRKFTEQMKLLFAGIATLIILYLPFCIASGGYALVSLFPGGTIGTGFQGNIKSILFSSALVMGYILTLIHIYSRSHDSPTRFKLETYFLIILLLFFAFQPIGERFYIWITPLLALEASRDRKLLFLILFQIVSLALLRLQSTEQWAGLFAPLHPAFFMSRPFIYTFIAPFLSILNFQRITYRFFILITLLMIYRIIRKNSKILYEGVS